MNKRLQLIKYLISDFAAAALSWLLFYLFRKMYVEPEKFGFHVPLDMGNKFFIGLFFIPAFWLLLYYLSGYYKRIYRKSRLNELGQTLFISMVGVIFLFFTVLLDDIIATYKNYYQSVLVLLTLHFFMTYIPRLLITTLTARKIHNRIIGFNTLIVGSNGKAVNIYEEFEKQPRSAGNKFIGFVHVQEKKEYPLGKYLPHLGNLKEMKDVIKQNKVEEVLIAIEPNEHDKLGHIINSLNDMQVIIKAIPDMYDILTGQVKMSSIYSAPLIQISHDLMPVWQENLKRIMDFSVSLFMLILLSPLYFILILGVTISSRGRIFYSHERIGRYGKPFAIYKFRSMFTGAEKNGPELSHKDDKRITPFGKFMRKMRLDELPQFYNVLIGDMSLVGPRPERQFFIDQIVQRAPHYIHLLKVKPGITSWGQVKFGYAENVEEMIERLKYDIIYIENMSLYLDFKILIYTIKTVIEAKGK